jgi:hypothetical protein
MPDWQITAARIYCDAVDEDVTIIVRGDWSMTCTGYHKYVEGSSKTIARILKTKARRLGRDLGCEGPEDYRMTAYRDKLVAQEGAAGT